MSQGDDTQTSFYVVIHEYFVSGDPFDNLYAVGHYV